MTVIASALQSNQAIGGNGGGGPFFNGLGAGGAIANNTPSGTLTSTLTVVASVLSSNQSLGGDDDGGDDPGSGVGGAIHNGGTATVIASTFDNNLAQGGTGNTAGSSLVTGPGGGFGGAILNATSAKARRRAPGDREHLYRQPRPGRRRQSSQARVPGFHCRHRCGRRHHQRRREQPPPSPPASSAATSPRVAPAIHRSRVSWVTRGSAAASSMGSGPARSPSPPPCWSATRPSAGAGTAGLGGGDGWGGGLVNTTGGTAQIIAGVFAGNQAIGGAETARHGGDSGLGGGLLDGTFGDNVAQANPFGPSSITMVASTLVGNVAKGARRRARCRRGQWTGRRLPRSSGPPIGSPSRPVWSPATTPTAGVVGGRGGGKRRPGCRRRRLQPRPRRAHRRGRHHHRRQPGVDQRQQHLHDLSPIRPGRPWGIVPPGLSWVGWTQPSSWRR